MGNCISSSKCSRYIFRKSYGKKHDTIELAVKTKSETGVDPLYQKHKFNTKGEDGFPISGWIHSCNYCGYATGNYIKNVACLPLSSQNEQCVCRKCVRIYSLDHLV